MLLRNPIDLDQERTVGPPEPEPAMPGYLPRPNRRTAIARMPSSASAKQPYLRPAVKEKPSRAACDREDTRPGASLERLRDTIRDYYAGCVAPTILYDSKIFDSLDGYCRREKIPMLRAAVLAKLG